jgi:adenosine deaminase
MDLEEGVIHTLLGLRRGMLQTGITANLGLCIPRECKTQYHPRVNIAGMIVDAAIRFQHHGVKFIDLACDESRFEPAPYAEDFRRTIPTNIGRTAHADEMGGRAERVKNAFVCINRLAVSRFSHVYHLAEEEELLDLTATQGICLERHPLGFAAPSLKDQKLDKLLARGIELAIVSDDPELYNQTLTQNLKAVLDAYGWGKVGLEFVTASALRNGFFATPLQRRQVYEDFIRHGLDTQLFEE